MNDPRIEGGGNDRLLYVALFDQADAAAGVVRVDTRDPATLERLRKPAIDALYEARNQGKVMDEAAVEVTRAVLAALTEATP